ncbi:MAG: sigma-70 family RNA polymerase sigma factor [Chloroflexota bacterium]|nr:MAG: sigma-70 family RNA polymerase sigma factor [Chloroflexota bacterium]
MGQSRTWLDVVAECQPKIQRLRATLTAGGTLTPELQADLDSVILAMRNYLLGRANRLRIYGDDAVDEALLAIIEQLHRDLHSPGFRSMEQKFGSYISSVTNRVVFELQRKYGRMAALSASVSLDAPAGEDGRPRHEQIEDVTPARLAEEFAEEQLRARLHKAIARLPVRDQDVIRMRLEGVPGKEIARQLGMSPSNVTHIYNRVVERLRRELVEGA